MPVRSASRVYNQTALEVWFGNVCADWEPHFSGEALRRGREIYRSGQITGLELAETDAIVHCAFDRKDTCYAVIEWERRAPSVRSSSEDAVLGEAVAAAGLYEIEELVADEIAPVPDPEAEKDGGANGETEATAVAAEDAAAEDAGDGAEAPVRRLTPRLEGGNAGLRLTAYWTNRDFSTTPAFGGASGDLPVGEREMLVRLTGRAREAGFRYRRERGDFHMADPERIAPFLTHTRKRWEAVFGHVDLDAEARRMAEGVRRVEVVGRAETAGAESMRIDWGLKLGDEWLPSGEAERFARAGRGTRIMRGVGLVRIDAAQSDALAEWQVGAAAEWPRYMVFSLFARQGARLDVRGALRDWRERLTGADAGMEAPAALPELPEFLRPYQAHGVRWMAHLREHGCHGLLADEMGLGKTLQVLTLLRYHPVGERASLIVCPASVVPVWRSEIERWYPELSVGVLRAGADFSRDGEATPDIWIASYTQLRRHKPILESVEFGYAVLDEAQQIKNPEAKVTQACCAIRAECRFALTGTPLENRLLDLWTIFRFLMPGLLGSRRRFGEAAENSDAEARHAFEARLRRQIAPFLLRRTKDEVGRELPPKVEMDLVCPITGVQRQAYEGLLEAGRRDLGDDLETAMREEATSFFTLLTRLRQVCCDPGLVPSVEAEIGQSGKVRMLLTRLGEALHGGGSGKVVVFSQFVQLLKRLKPLLAENCPEARVFELTGATRDRSRPVERFQNHEGPAIMLVSLRAGGTGITLHAADYVFLLDPWWNPAVENQAVDRVHRIGQERRVFVYRMITEGTIEERIRRLKREKRALFEQTLGHLGSARDLREHFGDLRELAQLMSGDGRG